MKSHENPGKLIRYGILSVLISFAAFSLSAQNPRFQHYAVEDGLSQSVILSIHQDSEGFLWFGTQSGLSCYNGYEFVNYLGDPLRTSTLSNNWIYSITEDKEGNIYLGTKGGLNKFDKASREFTLIHYTDSILSATQNFIYGLASRENIIYINTPPYLTLYHSSTGESEVFRNAFADDGTVYDIGFSILPLSQNKLCITSPNGLSFFDLETKLFHNLSLPGNGAEGNGSSQVTAIFEEGNGNILVGTNNGLYLANPQSYEIRRLLEIEAVLSKLFIRNIKRDNENNLWIATEGGGLNLIKTGYDYLPGRTIHYLSSQNFISHDIIYNLFIDNSENLWVGTIAGIDKTDLKKTGIQTIANTGDPNSYDLLDNVIASVFKDRSGKLWIGNWGKGLNILDQQRNPGNVLHYTAADQGKFHIPENHVHVIFCDSKDRIFIGTRDGVSVFEEKTQRFIPAHEYFSNPEFDCFSNIRVYCMMEDRQGKIWVGTGNGVTILDLPSNRVQMIRADDSSRHRLNSNLVYSILEDEDGEIWIAGSAGINRYIPEKDTMLSMTRTPGSDNTLINDFTISLCEDNSGNIWIGTGSGLNRFSKKDSSFLHFTRADGLPSDIFYDIIEDNNQNLWFTTGRGILTLDPDQAENGKFQIVDQLKGQEFNIKAVHKSKDGELFFGSMNGLSCFYPDSLMQNKFIPPIRITSIERENNGKLENLNPWLKKIYLTYRDYAFTIEFAALDFTSPGKNRYSYQMEGLSDSWYDLGERRFVHFTNLPSGSYTFKVKGTNSDGLWNEVPAILRIHISPPWWASNYAFIGYFILLVLLIILVITIRERNLKLEKRKLEIEVKRRTAEIARQKQFAEESEQKLRSTVQSLDDIMFVLDEKGRLQEFYNPGKRKTHFIFPELHIGKHFSEIKFPEDVVAQFNKAYQAQGKETGIIEFDHHFNDGGNIFWYNTKTSPKKNVEGKLTGLVVVARDITDRKHAEELLERQKEELNELNSAKDKFFSILAHDLKNPFTNLYSLGEILVKNYHLLDEEDKIEALKKIHHSSGFIYELLENLYTWSRSQRGKINFDPGVFDLYNIAEVNVNLYKAQADNKGVILVNEVCANSHAFGDREMINTVMRNLLNNAVKFSNRGGKIYIRAEKNLDHFIVSIKDEGIGISEEDQKKLFRLDEKYKTKGTSGETGTGLGLVLCKEFIEKHGEKIWCKSRVGEGTVFSFGLKIGRK